nr:MAG: internal scaffolding protein [Microvirus sp.]
MAKQKALEIEVVESAKLNEVIIHETRRPDGSLRVQQDFSYCPSLAEQHLAHMTDLNHLIAKYKPDELAAYIAARSQYRREIIGHDFSVELSLQDAHNAVYAAKKIFQELPEEVKNNFRSTLDFIKFIDNPANAEKMVKLGLISKKQVDSMNTGMAKDATKSADANDDVGGGKGQA